jgi:hypothetical protein
MRRFHVHVSVDDLQKSIAFYSHLFGQPTRVEADYAKWMIEDPRVNFAISSRGEISGVNHLGLQVDSADELLDLRGQLESADASLIEESDASCCYAKSDKYWITDPQGIAWETFHSLKNIPTFGGEPAVIESSEDRSVCCAPEAALSEPSCSAKKCCA